MHMHDMKVDRMNQAFNIIENFEKHSFLIVGNATPYECRRLHYAPVHYF
jgi:hypothetical protein